MQCACNVMTFKRSTSIDIWNESPKQPIIANGTNKYFTNGEIITEILGEIKKIFKVKLSGGNQNYNRIKAICFYLKMQPINQHGIENCPKRNYSNPRSISIRLDFP